MKKTSNCCNAPIRLSNPEARRGQTVYWICTKCENPCDEKVKISELIEGEESSLYRTYQDATKNDALKITIDHEGKRFFNGMPDYEYLKIEALNKIIDLLTAKEHHAE